MVVELIRDEIQSTSHRTLTETTSRKTSYRVYAVWKKLCLTSQPHQWSISPLHSIQTQTPNCQSRSLTTSIRGHASVAWESSTGISLPKAPRARRCHGTIKSTWKPLRTPISAKFSTNFKKVGQSSFILTSSPTWRRLRSLIDLAILIWVRMVLALSIRWAATALDRSLPQMVQAASTTIWTAVQLSGQSCTATARRCKTSSLQYQSSVICWYTFQSNRMPR